MIFSGADWANKLQHERIDNGDDYACVLIFGWILSGKSPESQQQDDVKVSYVKAVLDVLWEMEAPIGKAINWPEFPMSLEEGMSVKSQGKKLGDNTDDRRA